MERKAGTDYKSSRAGQRLKLSHAIEIDCVGTPDGTLQVIIRPAKRPRRSKDDGLRTVSHTARRAPKRAH